MYDKTTSLAEAIREREPNNPLLKQLNEELDVLKSIRVLMGAELKAYPGVHLLFVWHESVQPCAAENFLSRVYARPYGDISGDPAPATAWPIEKVLDEALADFGDNVLVIAPHIESAGGLYEALKELPPVRMSAFKHPALRALSFNKPETRQRVHDLLKQPDYSRNAPIAFIQSSDAHGSRGAIGHPRTEVLVPNARATFASIRGCP